MAEILIFGFCVVAAGKIFWDLAHLKVENPSGKYQKPSRFCQFLDRIAAPFFGRSTDKQALILQITDMAETLEESHKELRKRWPDSKDPERFEIEVMSYSMCESYTALRKLLEAIPKE